jgi:DNA-binding NarL/FixJ family response regulator
VPVSVLLVDDHEVVRSGLAMLLDTFPEIDVVGQGTGGEDGVRRFGELRPAVVLMDLEMPEVDGVEATRRILALDPGARVVVLTSFSDRPRIMAAIDAGAVGYLLKDATPQELERGILAAARGESPLDPRAAAALLATRRERPADRPVLSEREREVLVLVGLGLLNKQIARQLGISEKTVKAHLTSAFRRIGVTDRTQAALWAERRGLLDA